MIEIGRRSVSPQIAGASQSRLRRWNGGPTSDPAPQRASMLLRSAKSSGRRISFASLIVAAQVLLALLLVPAARSETLRVGKAVPEAFSFVPLDVGIRQGIFKK